ncbi:MAG: hypothetical protein ABI595_10620 [Actinomycetota bacterium]
MNVRRRLAAGVAVIAFVTAACTITIGSPSETPGLSPDPSPSPVPTGPGSAAAAMGQLCEAPKTGSGSGVTPEGPTPPAIANVEQQVESVRGLRYTSRVDVKALTQEQIDRRLTKNFDRTYPVDFYARRSQAWGTIGVIPAGTSIRDALLAFQTGQVVGFYNPANGQLVYIGDADLSLSERFILAHELTHAIDDQHFGLGRLDSIVAKCDDEAFTAGLGAIEGSAQFFATQVILRFPSDAAVGGGGDGGSLEGVPPFISNLQLWPYDAGMAFVQDLDDRGGTPLVDRALTTFPLSTEQIIHPERWPYDTPQPVDVPDLGPALGAGWRDLDVMTVGEAWLQLMLELRLDADDAGRAATGWDGGLYRAWTDGSRTAVVLRTVWDSTADAQEFFDSMRAWMSDTTFIALGGDAHVDVGFASDAATSKALSSALDDAT